VPLLTIQFGSRVQTFSKEQAVTIGRSPDCNFQIDEQSISRKHSRIAFDPDVKAWVYTDSGSANGSYTNGVRINSIRIESSIEIRLGSDEASVSLVLTPGAAEPKFGIREATEPSVDTIIGKSAEANFILTDVLVSRRHARLIKVGQQLILEDLNSSNGTYLNGKLIRTSPVREGDVITVGNTDLTIREGNLDYLRMPSEKTGGLFVNDLEFAIKGGRKLLRGVNVRIAPGNLTAVIGPSGAGKSTFLKAVAGVTKPTHGSVVFDGFNVHENFDLVSSRIGMVPQDDVLHTTLKLKRALNYAAKLRLRVDGGSRERLAQVEKVIDRLELDSHKDTQINRLSGGQRKRASVALELLTEPSLLILDEPTSGLDPAMDRQVMKLLRELATDERGVMVVTHSVAHLDICDDVLVLAPGGMPAYYGPPKAIATYFGTTDWADIFAMIKEDPEASYQRYLQSNPKKLEVPKDLKPSEGAITRVSTPWFSQFTTLCVRQINLIFADIGYLAFLMILPIIVGLLVLVVPGSAGFGAASNSSPAEPSQLLAMLVIGAAFMGASISIRDLVGERPIFLRERAVGLPVSAYLSSKLVVFGIFSWFMAAAVTAVTLMAKPAPIQSNFFESGSIELFVGLGLTSMASMVSGLALSTLVKSSDQVMPLFIVFLMAQLVLNGGLLPITGRGFISDLSNFVIARWGFAMSASTVNLAQISPSLDEDPLWLHNISTWAHSGAYLLATSIVLSVIALVRLEGKYDR
jgi:ABC-type multidrug transport system ATPase subunit/pSer/pThr/pTyr-binding forkhead associated (FHA) protein